MTREAELRETEAGLVPASEGWFTVNARDVRCVDRPGRGHSIPLTGWREDEEEAYFPELGVNLLVLDPGEPIGMYHWEAGTEDFLVLAGEALLLVEGEERPLRQWDFVHCPPGTKHIIVGAGDGPCTVVAMGVRGRTDDEDNALGYSVDDVALRHGAGVEEETGSAREAYAHLPEPRPVRYDGWLDGSG